MSWWSEERRQAMELRRQQREAGSTYFDRASQDPDAPGGRFAQPHLVGSGAASSLPAPQWARDNAMVSGPDPLGICIDECTDMLKVDR